MELVFASDSSLLVVYGDEVAPLLHDRVLALFCALQEQGDGRIRNLHPGYASLLIDFDPLQLSHEDLAERVRQMDAGLAGEGAGGPSCASSVSTSSTTSTPSSRDWEGRTDAAAIIEIPVCYESEFGPDLAAVADYAGIPPEEAVQQHSSENYLVYFLGFTPGFAYLGPLPASLRVPRLASPRRHVAAGSVGLAGNQTGIYPVDSPGGWQIIGRTPWRMFDPKCDPPARLRPGDRVRFRRIDREQFGKNLRTGNL
jgi:KipI family sensor histidine kinase inhibitor